MRLMQLISGPLNLLQIKTKARFSEKSRAFNLTSAFGGKNASH